MRKSDPTVKDDKARLEQLKRKVYGIVARNYLRGDSDPLIVSSNQIEDNRGRINKAIRLLHAADVVQYAGKDNDTYREGSKYRIVSFEKDSKNYQEAPTFEDKWEILHDDVYNLSKAYHRHDITNNIGFKGIAHLGSSNAIYIYWHSDEYQILTNDAEVYPKAQEDNRERAVLRSIVEHELHLRYTDLLETYMGMPKDSLKHEILFGTRVRNFSSNPVFLQDMFLRGPQSLENEYQHNMRYFQAINQFYQDYLKFITESGGPDDVIKRMRLDILEDLRYKAPLWLTTPVKDNDYYSRYSAEGQLLAEKKEHKVVAKFLVDYAKFLDYDSLYSEDTSVLFMKEGSFNQGQAYIEEIAYVPDRSELNIIQGYDHSAEGITNPIPVTQDQLSREKRHHLNIN